MSTRVQHLTICITFAFGFLSNVKADDKPKFNLSKLNPFNRFNKKEKDEPISKTQQLLNTVRTEPDEKKRISAVEELQKTDEKNATDVIPVLVASLKQDPSPAVRGKVAESISKIKPIAASAGVALEASAQNDPNESVRKSASTALSAYQQNGYRLAATALAQTNEPPAAKPKAAVLQPVVSPFAALASRIKGNDSTSKKIEPQTQTQTQTQPQLQLQQPSAKSTATLAVPSGVNRGPSFTETSEPPLAKFQSLAKEPQGNQVFNSPMTIPLPLPKKQQPQSELSAKSEVKSQKPETPQAPLPAVPKPLPAAPTPTPIPTPAPMPTNSTPSAGPTPSTGVVPIPQYAPSLPVIK